MSPESIQHEAEALAAYLAKPDNRGGTVWLDSKDLAPADRRAVIVALHDLRTT